ncbi:MAG: Outer-membrane lipoprotein carrier protein [Bacteroidia bacterium]|nr:Outer-membrane lipoprotein carrier protein [Bacteroidia bacterium]
MSIFNFRFYFFTAYCLLLTVYSYAQYPGYKSVSDATTFRKKAQEYTRKTNSLESDFKQVKHLSMLTENSVSKGKFWFKKDNLLRWEYKEPVQYLIVLNSGKAYIKDNGKVRKFDMNSNRIFRQVNELMLAAVKGDILESADYKITYFEGTDSFLAELLPLQKNMKEYVKNILIYFDKKDFSVIKFRMTELSGDYTEVEFGNKKANISLESGIFTGN